ncbi:MAG: DUF1622 domain-containing protein [Pseudomonadota bacterium]
MSASESGHMMDGMTGGTSLEHLPFGLDEPVMHALEGLAICIDLIGVALILFGFFVALFRLLAGLRHGIGLMSPNLGNLSAARTILGTYILTGLEFMIASDIIHTVITREFTDLIFVGLLVLIRTAISFFLGREIIELQHEDAQKAATT